MEQTSRNSGESSEYLLGDGYIVASPISNEEKEYILKKNYCISLAVEKFLGKKVPENYKIPTIGFAFSGGGDRAMIAAAGCCYGAEKSGYFQIAHYTSGVSGSTWWQAFMHLRNQLPSECLEILKNRVNQSFFDPETINYSRIEEMLLKQQEQQGIEFVDIWGALLVERLFSDLSGNPLELTFEAIRNKLKLSTALPFPLFSTVIPVVQHYEWGEVNPWRSGSSYLDGFVSTQLFGSLFDGGSLTKEMNENVMPFFLGLFGSAYSISLYEILPYIKSTLIKEFLYTLFNEIPKIAEKHFAPAKIENYMYDYQGPFKGNRKVSFIDAGHSSVNIGVPPLLEPERSVDIIIICDASSDAGIEKYPELKHAAFWAKEHKRSFPEVTKPFATQRNMACFCDFKNSEAPIVIYIANPIQDSTLQFDYNAEEFDQLYNANDQLAQEAKNFVTWALEKKFQQLNGL